MNNDSFFIFQWILGFHKASYNRQIPIVKNSLNQGVAVTLFEEKRFGDCFSFQVEGKEVHGTSQGCQVDVVPIKIGGSRVSDSPALQVEYGAAIYGLFPVELIEYGPATERRYDLQFRFVRSPIRRGFTSGSGSLVASFL